MWLRPVISNGDDTFETRPATVLPVTGWDPQRPWFSGDVNGDGKDDLMFVAVESGCTALAEAQCGCSKGTPFDHAVLHAAISQGDGSFDLKSAQETCWSLSERDNPHWFVGDADGDGKSDFMRIVHHRPDAAQPWYTRAALQTAVSKGDGTFALNSVDTRRYWLTSRPPDFPQAGDLAKVGDFNGDAKSDFLFVKYQFVEKPKLPRLVCSIATINVAGTYDISEFDTGNLGPQFTNLYWACLYDACAQLRDKKYPNRWLTGDFNGDGATDIAIVFPSNVVTPTFPTTVNILKLISDKKGGFVETPAQQTNWFSNCYSDSGRTVGSSTGTQNCYYDLMFTVSAGDVNGDGMSDVMYAGHRSAGSGFRTNLRVDISPGTGLDTFRWTIADVNGDQ